MALDAKNLGGRQVTLNVMHQLRLSDMKEDGEKTKAKPKLLSGGNPQIPKGDGREFVIDYINAMPGWKLNVGKKLDGLILKLVPNVTMAVRWNTPFYGVEGNGWFIAFHCLTKYIKVTFFKGNSLKPIPPESSKQENVRYFHIKENDQVDEKLVASWIEQASRIPGDKIF